MAVLGGTQIISSQAGGGSGGAGLSGALPEFGNYTLYLSGGTTYARNNLTGAIDSSNADAAVVINAAIANMPNGGTIFFKNGVYNLNSLILETTGGFTNYYAIGIPGGGPTLYQSWQLIGESFTPVIDLFAGNTIQTNGVVLNVTSTAVSSVVAGSVIMGIWARPDIVNAVGATILMKNLVVRFPTNQRGNETAIDISQALMADYEYVVADFNIAWNNITFPVAGTAGLYGITTTKSSKEENYMKNTYAFGYNVGLDIQGEHTILFNSYAINCNHGIDYGVRGNALGHGGAWVNSGWAECARGLTMGANCTAGGFLNISGLDIEDASPSIFPAFLPVYHALETNSGNCHGMIEYEITQAGPGVYANPPLLFDGGGGTNFLIGSNVGWTSNGLLSVASAAGTGQPGPASSLATDNFTRADENPLSDGGAWTTQGTTNALQVVSDKAEATVLNDFNNMYWNALTWADNQYSEMTIGTLTGAGNNFIIPEVRMATAANSGYQLQVQSNGHVGLVRADAGALTAIGGAGGFADGLGVTAGTVFRISAVGSLIVGYRNGLPIVRAIDATYPAGVVGFSIYCTALTNVKVSLWAGGTFPALTFGATTATSATAGGNGDVPAQVVGYLNWNLNGTAIKIPYYAV